MNCGKERLFKLNDNDILQIMFADESEGESDMEPDEEDMAFLERAIDNNSNEVIIEHPDAAAAVREVIQRPNYSVTSCKDQEKINFKWKKGNISLNPVKQVDFEHGKVNNDVSPDQPMQILEIVCNFDDLTKFICDQSITYMRQKGVQFTTTIEEMKAFLGMNVVMGYHVLPSIRDYWSTLPDLHVPFIANIMPRRRFEIIRSALHFSDNDAMLPRNHPNYDRAFKIRPIITHFNKSFQEAVKPSLHQSIDEHMIKFKGKNAMKQYIKSKPIKWGFKVWCRNDSSNGYLYQFDLYTGKKMDTTHGLGEGVVLALTESIRNIGCEVYIDNFFNSPSLQIELLRQGINSCGTVRANRKGMPKTLKDDKSMKRGDIDYQTSNGISVVKWMDSRGVLMCSNFMSPLETITVKRRKAGCTDKIEINCPSIIKAYNQHMGGTDLMDQMKVTYGYDRRCTIKYYIRLFFDLFDVAIHNSFCVYKKLLQHGEARNSTPLTTLEFRQVIAKGLIGSFTNRSRGIPAQVCTQRRMVALPNVQPQHRMKKTLARKRCVQCAKEHIDRRTPNICDMCQVHLCFTADRNCFDDYHKSN